MRRTPVDQALHTWRFARFVSCDFCLVTLDMIRQYTVLLSRICLSVSFAAKSFVLLEVFAGLVNLQASVAAAVWLNVPLSQGILAHLAG